MENVTFCNDLVMIHVCIVRSTKLDAYVGIFEPPDLYVSVFDVLAKVYVH